MSLTFETFINKNIVEPGLEFNQSSEALSSSALLIREAEKRGWVVDRYTRSLTRFLQNGSVIGGLNHGVPSTVSSLAVISSNLKHATKQAFVNSGLPVADGKNFRVDEFEAAQDYFERIPKPIVVKASAGSMGDSVSVNVSSQEDFIAAWQKATRGLRAQSTIMLEEQFSGIDIRAFVIDGKLVAAVTRVPAFVVGDGKTTLKGLINSLMSQRKSHAYLRTLPVHLDHNWIAKLGLNESSIINPGEVLTLNRTANTHQGASNFAITELLSADIVALAETAAKSIPGLNSVGIDLMINSLSNADDAILLEANTSGSLLLHHYPAFGEPIEVAKLIIDSIEMAHLRAEN